MAEENTRAYCDEYWKLYDAWVESGEDKDWQAMKEHAAGCEKCKAHEKEVD